MPEYYDVTFGSDGERYCLDSENAKNLLKNVLIMRADSEELRRILEMLREVKE